MVVSIVLTACGSGSSATDGSTDAQRNAALRRDMRLCITGRTESPMTVYLSEISFIDYEDERDANWISVTSYERKETGPTSLIENSCYTTPLTEAAVYDAAGVHVFSVVARNPAIGEPQAILVCRVNSPTRKTYWFSEGLRRTFECGQFEINVERMTDSATEIHLQVNVGLV